MAGTLKGYLTTDILQGPGDLWMIGTAPTDVAVRLTLANDGTPDATAHPGSYHLGAVQGAISTVLKPKATMISADQYDAPVDAYLAELDGKMEATLAQLESQKAQWALGVGTYSTGAGYKQMTFGGTMNPPKTCVAVISASRNSPGNYVVSVLYVGVPTGGFNMSLGRSKPSESKMAFEGLSDISRTPGQQIGVLYQTLVAPTGGTPTAKNTAPAEIFEGPADLWYLPTPPADATPRVTIDATTLTPDAAAHPASVTLGLTEGPVVMAVTPKIDFIRADQADGPVDAYVNSISAKFEATMLEGSMDKLARGLGVGNYSLSAGAYAQMTFGGVSQPASICLAAIAPKRTAPTKAVCGCLFKVLATEGITWAASRTKPGAYKVTFTGIADVARTLGKTVGIFHEMI
jgi:hypothetical protein